VTAKRRQRARSGSTGRLAREIGRVKRELAAAREILARATRLLDRLERTMVSRRWRKRAAWVSFRSYREALKAWQREYLVGVLQRTTGTSWRRPKPWTYRERPSIAPCCDSFASRTWAERHRLNGLPRGNARFGLASYTVASMVV
jgi:hypothetical protein